MPEKKLRQNRNRSRRERRPNVYVQEEEDSKATSISPVSADEDIDEQGRNKVDKVVKRSTRISQTRRVSRQSVARGEVFTRMVPRELKKFSVLSAGALVILIVLTFALS